MPFHHLLCRLVNSPSAYVVLAAQGYQRASPRQRFPVMDLLLHFTPALRSSPSIPASFFCCSPLLATSRNCCVRAVIASAPPTSRGPCFASRTQTLMPSCRASSADRRPVGPAVEVSVRWCFTERLL